MQRITVFDTTLRDGEQSPGSSMTPAEKLRLAHQLDALGVDIIEAGFPISSPTDHAAVSQVAREVRRPIIAALARANEADIVDAAAALEHAQRPRIHIFLATSDIHLRHKLRISRQECMARAVGSIEQALHHVDDVEFSAEDATRTDPAFLYAIVEAVIAAGARTINLPDTVGYTHPREYRQLFENLRRNVPSAESIVLSAHCHNDLGLAVANTLAAVEGCAAQVECTINGIGERAGNAALEEVVMALHTRHDAYAYSTGIETTQIHRTSHLLSHITGVYPPPNKAVVGRNAFAHEAGIHQDGMIKNRLTYEIMRPETVGVRETHLVLGKHSGRHALGLRCRALGYDLADDELERAYEMFKNLAAQKKHILDEDLISLLHHGAMEDVPRRYELRGLTVMCGMVEARADVTISYDGEARRAAGLGDGPIAAAFAAIEAVVDHRIELEDLSIHAVTPGGDALGEVAVRARVDGKTFTGRGASPDIVQGAARAYLDALDKASHAIVLEAEALEKSSYLWGV